MSYFISNNIAFSITNDISVTLDVNYGGTYIYNRVLKRAKAPTVTYHTDPYDLSISAPQFSNYLQVTDDASVNYILIGDLECDKVIIPDGVTLYPNGFKIRCNYLEVNGTINSSGKNGRPGVIRPIYSLLSSDYAGGGGWSPALMRSYTWGGTQVNLSATRADAKIPPFGINSRVDTDYTTGRFSTDSTTRESGQSTIGRIYSDGGLGSVGGGVPVNYSNNGSIWSDIRTEGYQEVTAVYNSAAKVVYTYFQPGQPGIPGAYITTQGGEGGAGGGSHSGTLNSSENYYDDGGNAGYITATYAISAQDLYNGFIISPPLANLDLYYSYFRGGSGGGAGGSTASGRNGTFDANNMFEYGLRGVATGGCGGDGGMATWICARKIVIGTNGKIISNGGNGGNGRYYFDSSAGGGTNAYSIGGGGGGGGGGWIFILCEEFSNSGIVSVAGGSGGSVDVSFVNNVSNLQGKDGERGALYLFSTKHDKNLGIGIGRDGIL